MAPIRRYLRISETSILECRIHLDNPALAQTWLLHPRHRTLPRVIDAIRPLVLPKLREERERLRSKKKASKKSRVKDVIARDDFEVSVFLTNTGARHSILCKRKQLRERGGPALAASAKSAAKLTVEASDGPVDVDETDLAPIRVEDDDDDDESAPRDLSAIPAADGHGAGTKRARHGQGAETAAVVDADAPGGGQRPPKRRRELAAPDAAVDELEGSNDKKDLAMDVSYDGFSIYGLVLCLIVKRREDPRDAKQCSTAAKEQTAGQARMDNWVTSTQV